MVKVTIEAKEVFEKIAKRFGSSSHVILPQKLRNKKVTVIVKN